MKNRAERLISFLVVWLTMFSFSWVSGQIPYPQRLKRDFSHLSLPGTTRLQLSGNTDNVKELDLTWGVIFGSSMTSNNHYFLYSIPSNVYFTQSGVFCKVEWELEKASRIPFRFRLGSLADCNAMEGKH